MDIFEEYSADAALSFDPNDTRDAASFITEGQYDIQGNGEDWYRFDAPAGNMAFSITATEAPLNLSLELYDERANPIFGRPSPSATESFEFFNAEDKTYFLRVATAQYAATTPPPDLVMTYTMTIDLADDSVSDGNDTRARAQTLAEGTHAISGSAVDWFRLESTAGEIGVTLNADADANPQNLNAVLYNAAGQVVGADNNATGNESFTATVPTDGDYFLKVFWAGAPDTTSSGIRLDYTLGIDLPEVAASDGNDTRETARTLGAGSHAISGTAVDWFRLESTAGEIGVTLNVDADANPQNLNAVLYNEAGEVVGARNNPTGNESFTATVPADGDYFLKIFWAGAPNTTSSGVKLDYSLDIVLPEIVESDGNDTFATAQPLAEGRHEVRGTAVDWYRLDSLSGRIDVALTTGADAPRQNLNVELYAADGITVLGADTGNATGNESFSTIVPEDGDYYLKVYWAAQPDATSTGIQLHYTLDIGLPDQTIPAAGDPGATRATATPIPANGTYGFVGTGMDWFRIDTGPGRFTIDMTDTGEGVTDAVEELNLNLFAADGTLMQANRVEGGTETVSFLSLTGGTYYVRIASPQYPNGTPNGLTMNYDLTVDVPQGTWATELDFGPVRNASVAVFDIDNDGKDEIFVGTAKALDAEGNEIRPGGLIVLEDDGTVKWTQTFEATAGVDGLTGKVYNTSSVTTQPIFSDLNGDGRMEIVVGVGAGVSEDFNTPGQPGDKGGLYALDADGNKLWFHQTKDVFGSALDQPGDGPDGRTEGVYATPRVFDIDADGKREVLYTSWDHRLYVLDGKTGATEREFDLHDTASATPNIADVDGDGLFEIVVASDITSNTGAGVAAQGGLLQVLTNYAQPIVQGWTDNISSKEDASADFRGKFIDQALWSSPKIADLDRDGSPEIIHGTSNFFTDGRGQFVKVWNADGTERFTLPTTGEPRSSPLVVDLDGDGSLEIVATTLDGFVYGWDAGGTQLFRTQVTPFVDPDLGITDIPALPSIRQAIAVDLDNADDDLEILVSIGSQTIVLDSDGTQLTSTTKENSNNIFQVYSGSPVAKDIDGDGRIDLVSGGTTIDGDQAVIYRWDNPFDVTSPDFRTGAYQSSQSLHEVQDFVERFYSDILGRDADPFGRNFWTDALVTGVRSGADVAAGFIGSPEFQNRDTSNDEYVRTLYSAFFGRPADQGGLDAWVTRLEGGTARGAVLAGFTGSAEFSTLAAGFGIRAESGFGANNDAAVQIGDAKDSDILRGGAGNNLLNDEGGEVTVADNQKDIDLSGSVYRIYGAALGRGPDAGGFEGWVGGLTSGSLQLEQVAGNFVGSREFVLTYGSLDNPAFVNLLYQNVLGRAADQAGLDGWLRAIEEDGRTRAQVLLGFSESGEYRRNTIEGLDDFMRTSQVEWLDVIEGRGGDDVMNAGIGSDIYVFRASEVGNDVIHGFEPWDQLQLSGFGYATAANAIARMGQVGEDVVFDHAGQTITFTQTRLADMNRVHFNI